MADCVTSTLGSFGAPVFRWQMAPARGPVRFGPGRAGTACGLASRLHLGQDTPRDDLSADLMLQFALVRAL